MATLQIISLPTQHKMKSNVTSAITITVTARIFEDIFEKSISFLSETFDF